MTDKKELAVAALRNGIVIDHIPSDALFRCVKILNLESLGSQLTIGNNLMSTRGVHKGIIKVADATFPDDVLDRIAIIAPTAVVNIIKDYNVVEKRPVNIPDEIVGIVKCDNPKCITNNEPMATRFEVSRDGEMTLRCHYCCRTFAAGDAEII